MESQKYKNFCRNFKKEILLTKERNNLISQLFSKITDKQKYTIQSGGGAKVLAELKKLKENLRTIVEENKKLHIKQLEELRTNFNENKFEIINKPLKRFKLTIDNSGKIMEKYKTIINGMKEENEELKKRNIELTNSSSSCNKELQTCNEGLTACNKEREKMEEENKILDEKLKELQDISKKNNKLKEKLQKELLEKKEEIGTRTKKIVELEKQIKKLTEETNTKSENLETVTKLKEKLEKEIKNLNITKTKTEKILNEYSTQNSSLSESLDIIIKEKNKLKRSEIKLLTDKKAQEEEIKKLKAQRKNTLTDEQIKVLFKDFKYGGKSVSEQMKSILKAGKFMRNNRHIRPKSRSYNPHKDGFRDFNWHLDNMFFVPDRASNSTPGRPDYRSKEMWKKFCYPKDYNPHNEHPRGQKNLYKDDKDNKYKLIFDKDTKLWREVCTRPSKKPSKDYGEPFDKKNLDKEVREERKKREGWK